MSNIQIQLHSVQKALNVPKDRRNSFANFNYRNSEDILEGLKKVLPEECAVTISDEMVLVGDRYYIQATATFYSGSESISVKAYAREPLEKKGYDPAQITGATSSYARKYALNGLFAIDDSDDADSDQKSNGAQQAQPKGHSQVPPKQVAANQPVATISDAQVMEISALIHKAGLDPTIYCQGKKIKRLQDMQASDYAANHAKLKLYIKQAASELLEAN